MLLRYAVAGLIWSVVGAGFVAVFSIHYYDRLSKLAPHKLVLTLFIVFWILLLIPLLIAAAVPAVPACPLRPPGGEPCHPVMSLGLSRFGLGG